MYIRMFRPRASLAVKMLSSSIQFFYILNEKYIVICNIVYSDTKTLFDFLKTNALFHLFKEFKEL